MPGPGFLCRLARADVDELGQVKLVRARVVGEGEIDDVEHRRDGNEPREDDAAVLAQDLCHLCRGRSCRHSRCWGWHGAVLHGQTGQLTCPPTNATAPCTLGRACWTTVFATRWSSGLRNPVVLAKQIATLGLAAKGRVEVGLGAGWLSSDYEEAGIEKERPAVRVDRLAESLAVLKALWSTGGSTFSGRYYQVRGARWDLRPEAFPRVIVGGGSRRVLMLAAREADIVNVTVPAGSEAANNATSAHFDQCLAWVRTAAADCVGLVELQVTAFAVVIVRSGCHPAARYVEKAQLEVRR